jgi:hypothetical protein
MCRGHFVESSTGWLVWLYYIPVRLCHFFQSHGRRIPRNSGSISSSGMSFHELAEFRGMGVYLPLQPHTHTSVLLTSWVLANQLRVAVLRPCPSADCMFYA